MCLKPPKRLCPGPDILLKNLKPLDGLEENLNVWGRTIRIYLVNNLGVESPIPDAALFFKVGGARLTGICATNVDDSLHVGTNKYAQILE